MLPGQLRTLHVWSMDRNERIRLLVREQGRGVSADERERRADRRKPETKGRIERIRSAVVTLLLLLLLLLVLLLLLCMLVVVVLRLFLMMSVCI